MNLRDPALINKEQLKKTSGVLGVAESSGQFQVVLGNRVGSVHDEVVRELNGAGSASSDATSREDIKPPRKNPVSALLDVIAGVFTPILPAIIAAGLIKGVLVLLVTYNLVNKETSTFEIINAVSDAGFFFLPVFLGFTSGLKFGCNPYLAAMLGGILVHPAFNTLMASGAEFVSLFGLPVKTATYASSVLPVILSVWFMSHVERGLSRVIPASLKTVFQPLLTVSITLPFMICLFAPVGAVIGKGLATGFVYLYFKAGLLAGALLGGALPFIILTGMHTGFFPVMMESIAQTGYDYILAICIASNAAQAGAVTAIYFMARNKTLRGTASASAINAIIGITEPALFGITARLRKPLIAVSIAGAIGGAFMAWFQIGSTGIGTGPLAGLPFFFGPKFVYYLAGCLISFITAFVLCRFIRFDEALFTGK
jgi:PTS system beta-glucosides-specific IIC component